IYRSWKYSGQVATQQTKESSAKSFRPIVQEPPLISFRGGSEIVLKNQTKSVSPAMFNEIIAIAQSRPDDPKAQNDAGVLLDASSDHMQALNFIEKAERLAPQDPVIAYNHAHILYELGRIDNALTKLQDALKNQPQFVEAHVFQSIIYIDREDY